MLLEQQEPCDVFYLTIQIKVYLLCKDSDVGRESHVGTRYLKMKCVASGDSLTPAPHHPGPPGNDARLLSDSIFFVAFEVS